MARLDNIGKQFLDSNGDPVAGGKLFFYETGTSTPATTYSDQGETSANANPVILDADGRMPDVFYSGQLKITLTDANDVVIETRDPVGLLSSSGLPAGGNTDDVLTKASNADFDVEWSAPSGGGGGWWTFTNVVETRDIGTVAGSYYFVDPDGAAANIRVTLPASPSEGDAVGIRATSTASFQAKVDRNGSNIEGGTQSFSDVTVAGGTGTFQKHVSLVYVNATIGWTVFHGQLEIAA